MTVIRVQIDDFRFDPASPPLALVYPLDDLLGWPAAKFALWARRLGQAMNKPGACVVTLEPDDDEDRVLHTVAELLELRP
jgi:hypothetical protein